MRILRGEGVAELVRNHDKRVSVQLEKTSDSYVFHRLIRERNREKYGLPTVFSILIYTHPETGFPLAICDGSYHTVMRTGSAAAVSASISSASGWRSRSITR